MLTTIGSGQARQQLPLGREAIERAVQLCESFGGGTPALASVIAFNRNAGTVAVDTPIDGGADAGWLPAELRELDVEILRSLASGEIVLLDGERHQLMGERLVWLDRPCECDIDRPAPEPDCPRCGGRGYRED